MLSMGPGLRRDDVLKSTLNADSAKKNGRPKPAVFHQALRSAYASLPWHCLNFFPLPHGHGSLRPTFMPM